MQSVIMETQNIFFVLYSAGNYKIRRLEALLCFHMASFELRMRFHGGERMIRLEQSICEMLEKGECLVLATILSHAGSTPRTAGTKMVVCADGKIIGTIGGGLVEAEVMKAAGEIFDTKKAQTRNFNLTAAAADTMDMICGGHLEILLEPVEANPPELEIFRNLCTVWEKGRKGLMIACLGTEGKCPGHIRRCLITDEGTKHGDLVLPPSLSEEMMKNIQRKRHPLVLVLEEGRFLAEPVFVPETVYIFGAGHVSQKVAILTRMSDFRTVVLDDREEFANWERFPEADEIKVLTDFKQAFSGLEIDRDSYAVIVTRGHSHDKTVLEQALRSNAGYIGMIGSIRKRDAIYKVLSDEGFTLEDFNRVNSPIGLSIGAETPEEIAVSIVAELIAARVGLLRTQI